MAIKKAATKKTESSSTKKKTAVKKKAIAKPAVKKVAVKAAVKKATAKKAAAESIVPKAKSTRKKTPISPDKLTELLDAAVEGIQEIKGQNITILDLRKISSRVCDYYIICNADSKTQVKGIADSVDIIVKKKTGENPYHIEGTQNAEWILIDYVNVVIHVFQTESRYFYNLESLWADAEVTKIPN
jgi:ribosome-associated protein